MHVEKLKWCRSCAFMFFACLISLANCEWIKSDAGPNKGDQIKVSGANGTAEVLVNG